MSETKETENKESENNKFTEERPDLDEKLSELEILRQSLQDAKRKEESAVDQLLRLGAEFETFRRRSEKRIADAREFGKQEILSQAISLMDILTSAVKAADQTDDIQSFKEGLTMVHKQFEKFLSDQGLEKIPTVGTQMDPHKHEVLSSEIKEGAKEGFILGEIQPGYVKNGRVVRTAKVHVAVEAQAPETAEQAPKEQEENHA